MFFLLLDRTVDEQGAQSCQDAFHDVRSGCLNRVTSTDNEDDLFLLLTLLGLPMSCEVNDFDDVVQISRANDMPPDIDDIPSVLLINIRDLIQQLPYPGICIRLVV